MKLLLYTKHETKTMSPEGPEQETRQEVDGWEWVSVDQKQNKRDCQGCGSIKQKRSCFMSWLLGSKNKSNQIFNNFFLYF